MRWSLALGFLFAIGNEAPARPDGLQFGVVAKLKEKQRETWIL
jgi:hypothetical protein